MLSVVENPSQTSKQHGDGHRRHSTTRAAYELAQELGVYMPITQAIYRVIYEGVNIKEAITDIMSNEFKAENEWS